MSQKKYKSAIESITNTTSGLVVSFLIQIMIYPALGIDVSIGQNVLITFIFFVASFFRNYIIRRIFNKIGNK